MGLKPMPQAKYNAESGMALVTVVMLSGIMLLLAGASAKFVMSSQKDISSKFTGHAQAGNIAIAGLQDAIGWFKRQGTQPVRVNLNENPGMCDDYGFKPLYNADELKSATIDEDRGIVRDIQITGNIYGRYIVPRQKCSSEGGYDGEKELAVHDVTNKRGKQGKGAVWSLFSEGIVYIRNDFQRETDGYRFVTGPEDSPNRILERAGVKTEIARLSMNTESAAVTLTSNNGGYSSSFSSRCGLIGGTKTVAALMYYQGGPVPGNPPSVTIPSGAYSRLSMSDQLTPDLFFDVSPNELRSMSDNIYTNINQLPELPNRIPFSISYLDGNFTFNMARPLVGEGLLYVNGNLTLENQSNSIFTGIIYVTGTLTMGRDNSLSGAVIARNVHCNPTSGQSSFEYNDNVVSNTRLRLGLYRENNLAHATISNLE